MRSEETSGAAVFAHPAGSLELAMERLDRFAAFLGAHIELVVALLVFVIIAVMVLHAHLTRYRSPRRFVSRSAQRKAHRNGAAIRARTRAMTYPVIPIVEPRTELITPLATAPSAELSCPWCPVHSDVVHSRGMDQVPGAATMSAVPGVLVGASA